MAPVKISIEGNIGSGKSTVMTRLCQETRLPVFLEPVDEWSDWLTMFYADPCRWGMSFNINVLLSFNKWKNNNFLSIYERSPVSNRYVFSELQYDTGRMIEIEHKLFGKIYNELAWTPDVVIYIKTSPEVSQQRMQQRARKCEDEVPLTYLQALHNKYEKIFNSDVLHQDYVHSPGHACKVIIVDGNQTADQVFMQVLAHVKKYMD